MLSAAKIGTDLSLVEGKFTDVEMHSGEIGGWLSVSLAHFSGNLDLVGIRVLGNVYLGGRFDRGVGISFSSVGGSLNTTVATFRAMLVLSGSTVRALVSEQYDWPAKGKLNIDGFTYGFLAGAPGNESRASGPTSWFVNWLDLQSSYAPQPYEQCAKFLRESGQPDKANAVLFAGKVRERQDAFMRGDYFQGGWLAFMQGLVGHGIGVYSFLALFWVSLFGLGGAAVARRWPPSDYPNWGWRQSIIYSLQVLLPFLKPSKEYGQLGFPPGVKVLFFTLNLLGWILAFFVAAGLTGLTRKP